MESTGAEPGKNLNTDTEVVIQELDKVLNERQGIKVSEAWKYREEVRAKYGLPECGYRWEDPTGYIKVIENFLKKNCVQVRSKHEFMAFFRENSIAQALHTGPNVFRDSTVVIQNASDSNWFQLRARASQLAHESVHAFQAVLYPRMPDEEAEKEAFYYQMITPQQILKYKDDPNFLFDYINDVIKRSIRNAVKIDQKLSGRTKQD